MHVSEYDNNAIYTLLIALIALNCKLLDMYAQIKQTNKLYMRKGWYYSIVVNYIRDNIPKI